MQIDQLISFIKEADKLKDIHRKTKNYHSDRFENSGEHSWHLALAALAFSSESNEKVDLLKCIKMALLHDLVEIDAGDTIVYAEDPDKYERELLAAKRIFGLLPKKIGDEFLELWIEFEKKETAESQYVGSLDRFLPIYSNILHDGHSWKKHDITKEMVYKKNEPAIKTGSKSIWEKVDSFLTNHFSKRQ